jgi:hypothetical protein
LVLKLRETLVARVKISLGLTRSILQNLQLKASRSGHAHDKTTHILAVLGRVARPFSPSHPSRFYIVYWSCDPDVSGTMWSQGINFQPRPKTWVGRLLAILDHPLSENVSSLARNWKGPKVSLVNQHAKIYHWYLVP